MKPTDSLHTHHRERMRQKYLKDKDAMTDHEILELLLFSVIAQKNTNPIAHRLLRAFGSLKGVLEADMEALTAVEGVGKGTAFFLKQLSYFFKRAEEHEPPHAAYETLAAIGDYLVSALRGKTREAVYLLLLDGNSTFLGFHKLVDGSLTAANVNPREIARTALSCKASKLILAHNHPAAEAEPSDDDVAVTRFLRRAFAMLDLTLEEHFVVSGNRYTALSLYLQERREPET